MYCSDDDICQIGCFGTEACRNLDLYCNGTCLVDCDDEADYQCPTVRLGSYSVWYSSDTTNNNIANTSTSDQDTDNNTNNDKGNELYDEIVNGFLLLVAVVAGIIAVCLCIWRCIVGILQLEIIKEQKLVMNRLEMELDQEKEKDKEKRKDRSIRGDFDIDAGIVLLVGSVCVFLGFVCIMYGFGQITQLIKKI